MRFSRWIDHLPPWLAFGAIVSTEVYEPSELVAMAVPLLFGALAEWRRWGLGPWRRFMELLAVACLIGLVWTRIGLVPSTIIMLFLLCGIRLSLPREAAQRRQILLMGFLVWITTAIATFDLSFLAWSILWAGCAGLVLMQHAWEGSAGLRGGPLQDPPYRKLPGWALGTVVLSAVFFVGLPRITLGLRAFPWGVAGLTAARSGLSDSLELGDTGTIAPNSEVVLRLVPPPDLSAAERADYAGALSLLRGIVLESLEGQTWHHSPDTWPLSFARMDPALLPPSRPPEGWMFLDCFVAPSPQGILPLPYGNLRLLPPPGMPVYSGRGGSLRWMFPSRRPIPLQVLVDPSRGVRDRRPSRTRAEELTQTGTGTESADHWSRREVPEEVPPRELAERLSRRLRTFRYTLDNPSGGAPDPLRDFLERSRAGHCEYFASALAIMLRHRGVPARVVNGYRLGPWIPEGGYWLVTENEAHSWVEYFDAASGRWRIEDPTPAAPPSAFSAQSLWAAFQRWTDALRFRWDRHVVRFSDQDQVAGLEWIRARVSSLPDWRPDRRTALGLLSAALVPAAAWWAWRLRHRWPWRNPLRQLSPDPGLPLLKPLLRASSRWAVPGTGETARQWLHRLAAAAPERSAQLASIADEVDAVAYGGNPPDRLKELLKPETRAWKRMKNP